VEARALLRDGGARYVLPWLAAPAHALISFIRSRGSLRRPIVS
jgi:hypothetical protein